MWLTTIPCIDLPQDKTLHKIEISMQNEVNQAHQAIDLCSPFCSCNCCQSNFYTSYFISSAPSVGMTVNYYNQVSNFQNPELFDFRVPPKS
jgi:hypothetical protein